MRFTMKKEINNKVLLMTSYFLGASFYCVDVLAVETMQQKNNNASCDSTCSVGPTQVESMSRSRQRVVTCGVGFSGSKVESIQLDAQGKMIGSWAVIDNSRCECTATYENISGQCPVGQKGEYTNRRNWQCSSSKSGSWLAPYNIKNTCYVPCAPLAPETRTGCPSGQLGSKLERRTSSCQIDDRLPPVWSGWSVVSNSCYTPPPPPPPPPPPCSYASEFSFSHMDYTTTSGVDNLGPWTRSCSARVMTCTYSAGGGVSFTQVNYEDQNCQVIR